MLGNLGSRIAYNAARGQWRSYQKSRKAPGGPWTFTAALFCVWPFTALWAIILVVQDNPLQWALLGVNAALAGLVLLSSGYLGRVAFERRLMTRYQFRAHRAAFSPQELRERADLLDRQESRRKRMTPPPAPLELASDNDDLIDGLFQVECPVAVCAAPAGVPCAMGIAVPVVLITARACFCHIDRMTEAVRQGTVDADAILAQFDNNALKGLG